jgi:hypothetical protein
VGRIRKRDRLPSRANSTARWPHLDRNQGPGRQPASVDDATIAETDMGYSGAPGPLSGRAAPGWYVSASAARGVRETGPTVSVQSQVQARSRGALVLTITVPVS